MKLSEFTADNWDLKVPITDDSGNIDISQTLQALTDVWTVRINDLAEQIANTDHVQIQSELLGEQTAYLQAIRDLNTLLDSISGE